MFIYGEKTELKPNLGFWQLSLMAISGALGAGFFVLISQAITIGGALTPLAFFVASIASFLMSRVYAELATSMPVSGGGQVYIRNAFSPHPFFFIIHWITWLAELSFTALNALGVGFYVSLLVPINPVVIALALILLMVFINLKGVEKIGIIELITGSLMLISVVVLATLLFQHIPETGGFLADVSSSGNYFNWLYVIPLIFVIFIGNEDIAAIAAEVKDKKDIKKSFTAGIIGILVITVVFAFLFSQIFTAEQLLNNPQPFSLLGGAVGPAGRLIGIAVAILGCLSSLFFGSLADTRTAYAMAKAGEFPEIFTKLNRFKVPFASVISSGIIVSLLVSTGSASYVAYLASAGFLIEVIFITLALMKLRKTRPHLPRPVLVKPYPFVPIAVIVLAVIFLLLVNPQAWIALIIFSAIGFLVSFTSHINNEDVYYAFMGVITFILLLVTASALVLLL